MFCKIDAFEKTLPFSGDETKTTGDTVSQCVHVEAIKGVHVEPSLVGYTEESRFPVLKADRSDKECKKDQSKNRLQNRRGGT